MDTDRQKPYQIGLTDSERTLFDEFALQKGFSFSKLVRVAIKTMILLDSNPSLSYDIAYQRILMSDVEKRGRKKKCTT